MDVEKAILRIIVSSIASYLMFSSNVDGTYRGNHVRLMFAFS
jgi:hypothetical protein